MDAAIRWSTHREKESRFLIADAAESRLKYCEITSIAGKDVEFRQLSQLDGLPDFTAFDWSRTDENLVAIGTTNGESRVVNLAATTSSTSPLFSFPVKQQRECNSMAFSTNNLLATALKKHRTDFSLNVYDVGQPAATAEPYQRLASGDAVANVKFFSDQFNCLLAGIYSKGLRWYDLREMNMAGAAFVSTRQCHFLSIDPLDENYIASAGPPGENVINVWDRRLLTRSSSGVSTPVSNAILEIRKPIDANPKTTIRTMRFSGSTRGSFAVLSSAGQLRLFDVTTHPANSDTYTPAGGSNSHELESTPHYLKRSHDLRHPWWDKYLGQEESARAIAFDFARSDSILDGNSILSIRRNRKVEVIPILPPPAQVRLTPSNHLAVHEQSSYYIASPPCKETVAVDLLDLQARISTLSTNKAKIQTGQPAASLSKSNITNGRSRISKFEAKLSSRQRHEELLNTGIPTISLDVGDMLTVLDTQRRRCEEGYLFNCEKNKKIVSNDPWLIDLWDVVQRMELMAENEGMAYEALDLSFIGTNDLWKANIERMHSRLARQRSMSDSEYDTAIQNILRKHEYGDFEGVATDFPGRRQLGLAICGWKFSERRLEAKCHEILKRGEHYKAIVVAFCHGRKTVAIDILKSATRSGLISNSGLGAVIACDSVSKEQRSLCEWMAEDAEDPYLKALLTYFVTGSWQSIADMSALPLVYRVAVALKYLNDVSLGQFLQAATEDAIKHGDTEGIVLTGLCEDSMELFQNYIDKSNDLQTAVLATAFTNPRYVDDERWQMWKETYFLNMQAWRAFMERTRFTVQHSRKAVDRMGQKLLRLPSRQVTLRCTHCQKSISKPEDPPRGTTENGGAPAKLLSQPSRPSNPSAAAGTVCPRCGRHLPRCSICMLWLGTTESYTPAGTAAASVEEDAMAKYMNFCMSCGHGFHANHAREWFSKHQICPVPDCQCMCAQRR